MQSITKDEMESFIGRLERASAGFRSSLSPAIVKEWNDSIKLIPVMAEQMRNMKVDTDKVDGINTTVALHSDKITRMENTVDYVVKSIWGLVLSVAGILITGFIKLL